MLPRTLKLRTKNLMLCLLCLGVAFCYSTLTEAKEIFEYNQSIKSLGMGGVRYPEEDDATIMLWNPAGLGYLSGFNWRVVDVGLGLNGLQIYNDLQDVGDINGASSLTPFFGKNVWLGLNANSTFTLSYFGFAAYDNGFANLQLNNPAFPSLDVSYYNDYGFIVGGAAKVGPSGYIGMNAKRITRTGTDLKLGPDQLQNITTAALQDSLQDEGTGYGLDVGALWVAPVPLSPAISLAWTDIGSLAFQKSKGDQGPPRIKDNLTLGMTVHGGLPGLGIAAGMEYRHITDQGEQFGKKIHFGTEISLLMFDFRAGFYQGYPTYGVGIDLWFFQLDAAMYTVEKGVYPGQTPDQRVQIALNMNLSFDPNFNLSDTSGKRRRLKQRR